MLYIYIAGIIISAVIMGGFIYIIGLASSFGSANGGTSIAPLIGVAVMLLGIAIAFALYSYTSWLPKSAHPQRTAWISFFLMLFITIGIPILIVSLYILRTNTSRISLFQEEYQTAIAEANIRIQNDQPYSPDEAYDLLLAIKMNEPGKDKIDTETKAEYESTISSILPQLIEKKLIDPNKVVPMEVESGSQATYPGTLCQKFNEGVLHKVLSPYCK